MTAVDYDFYLFDLDGTIVDVEFTYARSLFDRVGHKLEYAFTDQEILALWHGLCGTRRRYLNQIGIDPDIFWQVFHAEEDPQERAAATFVYNDAHAIRDIAVPIGVVTHCQEYLTAPVLDNLGITDWFDTVVCCDEDIGWKPDPAPVRRAMQELNLESTNARGIYVGDTPDDIGAAWNAGLDGAHIERHSPELRGQCVLADTTVRSLTSVVD